MANRKTRKPYNTPPVPSLPTFGSVPIIAHTASIVFRLSRPRTWVFPSVSFILGYTISGGAEAGRLGLGVLIAALVTAATNIVNAYADRREDAINQPSRVFWVDRIGSRGAIASSILLYGSALALSINLGPLYIIVLAIGVFNSVFYSLPPLRFKADPLQSLISFSGAVGIAFLSGIAATGTIDPFNPLLWLVTYFMLTYGTVKNLPDYAGDKKAGTQTSATIFHDIKSAIKFTGTLLTTPYLLLLILVSNELLPTIYLADLCFLAILGVIYRQMRKSKTPEALERVHTFGFFYAISFLLFTLVLSSLTIESVAIVLAAYLWVLLVSKVNIDSRIEKRDWEKRRSNV